MKIVTVEITRGQGWYTGLEGDRFVCYAQRKDYIVKDDFDLGNAYWRHIDKADCIEVSEEADE